MRVNLIVAVAQNGVIGDNNALPWRLPADLKYFKKVTMGFPVVMGRKTYESIGRPLPGRLNIVVSRQATWQADQVTTVNSIEAALTLAKEHNSNDVFIIGGAQLYKQSLALIDYLYMTLVKADVSGDALFPEYDQQQWQEISRQSHQRDELNQYDYDFVVLERAN